MVGVWLWLAVGAALVGRGDGSLPVHSASPSRGPGTSSWDRALLGAQDAVTDKAEEAEGDPSAEQASPAAGMAADAARKYPMWSDAELSDGMESSMGPSGAKHTHIVFCGMGLVQKRAIFAHVIVGGVFLTSFALAILLSAIKLVEYDF